MLTYFICHLVGVSSCCTNPILYGFLNPNFSNVFLQFCQRLLVQFWLEHQTKIREDFTITALVSDFTLNALVGAFSVIVKSSQTFVWSSTHFPFGNIIHLKLQQWCHPKSHDSISAEDLVSTVKRVQFRRQIHQGRAQEVSNRRGGRGSTRRLARGSCMLRNKRTIRIIIPECSEVATTSV